MDEMRQLIGRRQGDLPFRSRGLSTADTPPARLPDSPSRVPVVAKTIEELASQADLELEKVAKSQDVFQGELKALGNQLKEVGFVEPNVPHHHLNLGGIYRNPWSWKKRRSIYRVLRDRRRL